MEKVITPDEYERLGREIKEFPAHVLEDYNDDVKSYNRRIRAARKKGTETEFRRANPSPQPSQELKAYNAKVIRKTSTSMQNLKAAIRKVPKAFWGACVKKTMNTRFSRGTAMTDRDYRQTYAELEEIFRKQEWNTPEGKEKAEKAAEKAAKEKQAALRAKREAEEAARRRSNEFMNHLMGTGRLVITTLSPPPPKKRSAAAAALPAAKKPKTSVAADEAKKPEINSEANDTAVQKTRA